MEKFCWWGGGVALTITVGIVIAKAQVSPNIWYGWILREPHVVPALIVLMIGFWAVALGQHAPVNRVYRRTFDFLFDRNREIAKRQRQPPVGLRVDSARWYCTVFPEKASEDVTEKVQRMVSGNSVELTAHQDDGWGDICDRHGGAGHHKSLDVDLSYFASLTIPYDRTELVGFISQEFDRQERRNQKANPEPNWKSKTHYWRTECERVKEELRAIKDNKAQLDEKTNGADATNVMALPTTATVGDRERRKRAIQFFRSLNVPQRFALRAIHKHGRVSRSVLDEYAKEAGFDQEPAMYLHNLRMSDLVAQDGQDGLVINAIYIDDVDAILNAWFMKISDVGAELL